MPPRLAVSGGRTVERLLHIPYCEILSVALRRFFCFFTRWACCNHLVGSYLFTICFCFCRQMQFPNIQIITDLSYLHNNVKCSSRRFTYT